MQKKIYLAGGCFWGTEKYFSLIRGVLKTGVGYANGNSASPSYEEVKSQKTGHAETVEIEYEDQTLPLPDLLGLFYGAIDPVSVNRQGPDRGVQYRTGIYYVDGADREVIEQSLADLQKRFAEPLAIELKPLENYYPAEEYHQKYLDKNPGGYCHLGPGHFERAAQYGH
jgi:peptide methionine sulfoxide reductase msrA/msrB